MQNAAFEDKDINCIYLPIEVKPDNLDTVIRGITSMNFDGFNITKPFKTEIMKYLDEVDELASRIGAVNAVVIKDGQLKGYNTDGMGFLRSLKKTLYPSIVNKRIFVLGSGGAARAICMVLAMAGTEKINICNRTYEKAVDLAEDINKYVPNSSNAIPMEYEEMEKAIKNTDILINATCVGTFPNVNEVPIDTNLLNNQLAVCDVVYNPAKTKLLIEAEKHGCKTMSGLGMLVYQGAEAFELWTGKNAPIGVMFDAIS
jgi:shikimate dehydrogenase